MSHHKRGRPKSRRGGCLLCKPHKLTRHNKGRRKRTTAGGIGSPLPSDLRANVSAKEQGAL
jgi:hypothetical protein